MQGYLFSAKHILLVYFKNCMDEYLNRLEKSKCLYYIYVECNYLFELIYS